MSPIIYKKSNAFKPGTYLSSVYRKINDYRISLENVKEKSGFQSVKYCNTEFSFHIAVGGIEVSHRDTLAYQAILILDPNGWGVRGSKDSCRSVFQDAGDLIIIDQSIMHQVSWDRHFPKPTQPWVYLLIDAFKRDKWAKSNMNKHKAAELAFSAIESIEDPVLIHWLNGGEC